MDETTSRTTDTQITLAQLRREAELLAAETQSIKENMTAVSGKPHLSRVSLVTTSHTRFGH